MRDSGEHMQIGEVAQRTELSIRTVRHYDDVGLVTPSARSIGGFRLYTEADVQRLLVIRRMKPLGFTLAEMKELLEALEVLDDPAATAQARTAATEAVHRCHARAEDSCERLRRHLAYAQELTGMLAEHAASPTSRA
ncbi:MerR family transcriptional regulator [Rhodococcus pyridinivorans]|uniref:MerR family transcriptional regulator n=1 Tax=Rhodococcus pyridinivorans TaxID=103816 RepID=UPI000BA2A7E4|nr:MerR family transcriptional regulator [Rhodococcus pyridinivorans]